MAAEPIRWSMMPRLRDDELRAWQALLHAHYAITRRLDAELRAEHDISMDDYDALLRLARADGRALRMTQLAERVLVPPSTLTRRVDELVRRGLVERSRSAQDSRVVIARLTDAGIALLRRAARTHLRGIHEYFSGQLSGKQLADLADGLEGVVGPHREH
jgi:DNA-binding MarR family transcriptional regulator